MKTKLLCVILLAGLAAIAFINYPASNLNSKTHLGSFCFTPPVNISDSYLIGAMDDAVDFNYTYTPSLGFNTWHKYTSPNMIDDPQTIGWDWYTTNPVDRLFTTQPGYSSIVTGRLDQNQQHSMRTLMDRPKIEQLAFGQRSDYKCCSDAHVNQDLWFYAFNLHDVTGAYGSDFYDNTPVIGNNQWVRHCQPDLINSPAGSGYVVSSLRANDEQCNTSSPIGNWQADLEYDWYIKPSIRADANFINTHDTDPICKIEIYTYRGSLLREIVLQARNFKDASSGSYDGKYLEEFNFGGSNQLLIPKQAQYNAFNPYNDDWSFHSRCYNTTNWDNKMDIRVHWYGTCEIWLDYVRVDNEIADGLFKGYYEGLDPNHPERQWLQWEAQLANHNPSPLKFYIEEFEFNNIPCMSYVSKKLKEYSGNSNLSLMSITNLTQLLLQLNWDYAINKQISADFVLKYLVDQVEQTQVFSEPYSLTGKYAGSWFNDSRVPETLLLHDYNPDAGRLGDPFPPNEYETWLQDHLDAAEFNLSTKRGFFTWYLKTMDTITKAPENVTHINMPQTHLWLSANGNDIGECLREPTNEELEMITEIPITYGAKGTLYFWYGGWGCIGSSQYG